MPESDILERAKQAARAGKYLKAAALFSEAGGTEGAYGEGACLFKLKRYAEARHALSHCLELDPQFEKAEHLIEKIDAEGLADEEKGHAASPRSMWTVLTIIAFLGLICIVVAAFLVYLWMAG